MGSIKCDYIKVRAREMMKENPKAFKTDFVENKKLVEDKTKAGEQLTKKTRNMMAGYITKTMKRE